MAENTGNKEQIENDAGALCTEDKVFIFCLLVGGIVALFGGTGIVILCAAAAVATRLDLINKTLKNRQHFDEKTFQEVDKEYRRN